MKKIIIPAKTTGTTNFKVLGVVLKKPFGCCWEGSMPHLRTSQKMMECETTAPLSCEQLLHRPPRRDPSAPCSDFKAGVGCEGHRIGVAMKFVMVRAESKSQGSYLLDLDFKLFTLLLVWMNAVRIRFWAEKYFRAQPLLLRRVVLRFDSIWSDSIWSDFISFHYVKYLRVWKHALHLSDKTGLAQCDKITLSDTVYMTTIETLVSDCRKLRQNQKQRKVVLEKQWSGCKSLGQ